MDKFELVLLTGFNGEKYANASAINSKGWVAGSALPVNGEHEHAVVWRDGDLIDLGTLGGERSGASDINDAGWVVGSSTISDPTRFHACLWRDGKVIELGQIPKGYESGASAINTSGQIVGHLGGEAFFWDDGKLDMLPEYSGKSMAADINDNGIIVGMSGDKPVI